MYDLTPAEATQTYADHVARLLARLTEDFAQTGASGGAGGVEPVVNLVTAHLTVVGAATGGGEREAHTVLDYAVPSTVFPTSAHYVALGHLHRSQAVPGPCPIRYSGSPLAVDFGEEENAPSVTIVEVGPDKAATTRQIPVTAAVPLRTVRGTLDDLTTVRDALDELAARDGAGQPWLRVYVRETPRAGLREDVQALLPRALEIRIDPDLMPAPGATRTAQRAGRSPRQLFADYLDSRGHTDDDGVRELFAELYEEVER
jgi:exonuclease SbcD